TPTTKRQEEQFEKFALAMVKKARKKVFLNKDTMQMLFKNGGKVQRGVIDLLVRYSASDDRFPLLNYFEITVPKHYNHATQLADFALLSKGINIHESITDQNFASVTHQLIPGKKYGVKIFGITRRETSEDCLAFYAKQRVLLVGAQGLSLAWQLKKKEFFPDKWAVSFDKKDALWKTTLGYYKVSMAPCIGQSSNGIWRFFLSCVEIDSYGDRCLICFFDLAA
ncbi:hypothetical protein HY797_03305, partial [Candidatus Falkowbacteria bacterium]|nr:hypothetical protein [Candidatus Falkowbacteria bacterium]